jgi:hypothetical protein
MMASCPLERPLFFLASPHAMRQKPLTSPVKNASATGPLNNVEALLGNEKMRRAVWSIERCRCRKSYLMDVDNSTPMRR